MGLGKCDLTSSVEDRTNVIERQASWLWTAVELGGCEWLNIEYCPAPMQLSLIECWAHLQSGMPKSPRVTGVLAVPG